MFTSVNVIAKLNSETDDVVHQTSLCVMRAAAKANCQVVGSDHLDASTLIIAVGGDGTMLKAMRRSAQHGSTALGVNLGKVGFLSDLNLQDPKHGTIAEAIEGILSNTLPTFVEERTMLTMQSNANVIAGNEISISPRYSDTIITYHLRIGDTSAGIHRANSILMSTATGSTAYSLSAGGALMMPTLDAIQIVPVAPITMTSRPLIVSSDSMIRLEVKGHGLTVRADGQVINHTETGDVQHFVIHKYVRKARVLHMKSWNYFDTLTQKLGWIKG